MESGRSEAAFEVGNSLLQFIPKFGPLCAPFRGAHLLYTIDMDGDKFKEKFTGLANELDALKDQVDEKLQTLAEKEAHWVELVAKINKNAKTASEKIKFDVGGQLFSTSKSTLMRIEGTYFSALIGSGKWNPDSNGVYFIDRDPTYFGMILNYMRDGSEDFRQLTGYALSKVRAELDYFSLPVSWPLWESTSPNLKIDEDDTSVVSKIGGGSGWNASALTIEAVENKIKFKVVNRVNGNMLLGLAPKSTFQFNTENQKRSGWYLYVSNGTLYSQAGHGGNGYASPVAQGSVVEITYDRNAKTISFSIDGNPKGVAYSNVNAQEPLYGAVGFHDQYGSVQLV